MRFADPQACPDCRGVIAGDAFCPHCGLDLASLEARQLWQVLLQADDLLARATLKRRPTAAGQPHTAPPASPTPSPAAGSSTPVDAEHLAPPAPAPPTSPAQEPAFRPYPAPAPPAATPRPGRSWSVGTILLVLGAFGLIVAGLIFVTRSWDSIGLTGKALILLGVTAVIGVLAAWVTRRPLRASSEAVWTVFLALLTLDFFAARHENLGGVGALDLAWAWVVWGIVVLALSLTIALWSRPHLSADLIAPAIAGGLAITMAGIGAGAVGNNWDHAWRAFLALVVAGLLALSTRPAGLKPMTLVARIVVAGFFTFSYLAALVELVGHPEIGELVGGGHGLPMVLMGVASLVIGWVVAVVRIPAVALAVLAASALAATPVSQAGGWDATWGVVAVLASFLAIVGVRGSDDWMRGLRVGAVPAVAGILLIHFVLSIDVLETMGRIFEDPWSVGWDHRLDVPQVDDHAVWLVPVVLVGLLVVTWSVPRWPELSAVRPHATVLMGAAAAVGAVDAVVALRSPVWAATGALLLPAVCVVALQLSRRTTSWGPTAALVVVAAAVLAAASPGVSAVAWTVGGLLLTGLALRAVSAELQQLYAFVAVALLLGGIAALSELLGPDDAVTPLVVLVAALGLLAAPGLALNEHPTRPVVEAAAAIGAIFALTAPGTTSELAVRWTLVGGALIALGFAVAGRRWYLWPGAAALLVAYVLVLVDSGFSFVEAYTLPLGAAALAVGLTVLRRRPETSTWMHLGPGLALVLLPSVPQALVDPTDLRALLLGIASLAVLAIGIRLSWQAPFVAGVAIATLIVLFNIGPYANAAPRVVLIAAVSAVLLGVGITWEDRVRDGRKLVGYVRSMR